MTQASESPHQHAAFETCSQKPCLVMGATGFVGSHTVRQLVDAGRDVRVMVRDGSDTRALDGLSVQRYIGDIFDRDVIREAMTGCGTVFYSVVNAKSWLTDASILYKTNVDGLRNVLDVAIECGVKRFIFTSSMATIASHHDRRATEADPYNWWDRAPDYIRSRIEAERLVLAAYSERGLDTVALCIANTYGPEDYQPTPHGGMLYQASLGRAGVAVNVGAPTVDIRDTATAVLLAERYGRSGERYIIANEFVSQPDLYAMAAECGGAKPPRTVSYGFAYAVATVAEFISRLRGKKDFALCRSSVFLSYVFGDLDHSKATRELGWTPRPIAETVRDAIAWRRQLQNK